jgi:hypothetical protein
VQEIACYTPLKILLLLIGFDEETASELKCSVNVHTRSQCVFKMREWNCPFSNTSLLFKNFLHSVKRFLHQQSVPNDYGSTVSFPYQVILDLW